MSSFDLQDNTVRDLNQALHDESAGGTEIEVTNPNGKHSVAVGAMYPCEVSIQGHVGYYCAGMNQQASITVHGQRSRTDHTGTKRSGCGDWKLRKNERAIIRALWRLALTSSRAG